MIEIKTFFRCFLVRSSNFKSSQDPTLDTFALSMMYHDNVASYRVLQVISIKLLFDSLIADLQKIRSEIYLFAIY